MTFPSSVNFMFINCWRATPMHYFHQPCIFMYHVYAVIGRFHNGIKLVIRVENDGAYVQVLGKLCLYVQSLNFGPQQSQSSFVNKDNNYCYHQHRFFRRYCIWKNHCCLSNVLYYHHCFANDIAHPDGWNSCSKEKERLQSQNGVRHKIKKTLIMTTALVLQYS